IVIVGTGLRCYDARAVLFLAYGLWAKFDTEIRLPAAGGLTACTAAIGAEILDLNPASIVNFGSTEIETALEATSGNVTEQLVLRPPHVAFRSGEDQTPNPWRITP